MIYYNPTTAAQASLYAIRAAYPNMSIPDGADLRDLGYWPLVTMPQPAHDRLTHQCTEGTPTLDGDHYTQVWQVTERDTPLSPPVPESVTMRQARLALLGAGLLSQVDAAINAMPEPQRSAAKIEWEYSAAVDRHRPLVAALGPALGLDDAALDALFVQAAGL